MDQGAPSEPLPSGCIALVTGDVKRQRGDKHFKTATWMEIALDIAVTHPQGADVWVGLWPPQLRQLLKTRFKCSNSTYNNALSNLSDITLTFYRKAPELSKTLAEAVSELWKDGTEEIKQLVKQTQQLTPEEDDYTQGRRHPQPNTIPNANEAEHHWRIHPEDPAGQRKLGS